jgi:hypothetical protein
MNEDRIRELLRDMRDEPLPADSLARVRAAVDERRASRSRVFSWKLAAALAGALAIIVGVIAVSLRAPARVEPAVPEAVVQPVEAPLQAAPAPTPAPVHRAVRRVKQTPPAEPASNVVIRIETPDPEVVILLVGE